MALTGARNRIANLLLALAAVLLAVLAVEGALRLLEPDSDVQVLREVATPRGSYLALRPGVSGLMLGRSVSVNAEGYRGALRSRSKTEGVMRVLFFGDSHTFSMGADDDHTYPAVVERTLNSRGLRCEVLNFGVPGQDLRQILLLLRDRAFPYEPDLIVITFHSGDILESPDDVVRRDRPAGAAGPSRLHEFKVELLRRSYLARLVIPYSAALLRGAFGWSGGLTHREQREIEEEGKAWLELRTKLLELKQELDRRGIGLAFVLFPSMLPFEKHPARPEFAMLSAWLAAHDIPALDLLPAFRGQRAGRLTASLLDKHPNEEGYAIAGAAVAGFLAGILGNRREVSPPAASVTAVPFTPVQRSTRSDR